MLSNMSWAQLVEWQEYYLLEPFGEERDDLRMGMLASLYVNAHKSKGTKLASPADFLMQFDKDKSANTKPMDAAGWQKMKSALKTTYSEDSGPMKPKVRRTRRTRFPSD